LANRLQGRRRNAELLGQPERGRRAPDELDPYRGPGSLASRGQVAGDEGVDVAAQDDEVLDARRMEGAEDLLALGRVAVPLVLVAVLAGGGVEGHHHRLAREQLPASVGLRHRSLQPGLLILAQEGAAGLEVVGAGLELHVVTRLWVAVLTLIGQEEL